MPPAASTLAVHNPATGQEIGRVAHASHRRPRPATGGRAEGLRDLARPATPSERSKIMRKAAALLRERAGAIAAPADPGAGQATGRGRVEAMAAGDIIEWFADEGLRVYGRIVPSRGNLALRQMVLKDPVGPVAAFTPWNFPINQVVRKVGAALAAAAR
jgi:succinate-semialdehyde dehydrogenase/glutarate-semialdehyde dehydrogenase